MAMLEQRINVEKPLWDLNTYWGRWKHYNYLFDLKNLVYTRQNSYNAFRFCQSYKLGQLPSNTSLEKVLENKKIKDATFHPLTGQRHMFMHRLAAMVPIQAGLCVMGARAPHIIPLLMVANNLHLAYTSSFGYVYRNTDEHNRLTVFSRTYNIVLMGGLYYALTYYQAKLMLESKHAFIRRLAPCALFLETTAAFLTYIRINEVDSGVNLKDENGNVVTRSRVAGIKGLSEAILARSMIIGSAMIPLPILMSLMDRSKSFSATGNFSGLRLPAMFLFATAMVGITTPLAFALFPPEDTLSTSTLRTWEPVKYREVEKRFKGNIPDKLEFNRGL